VLWCNPPNLNDFEDYEDYRNSVTLWDLITEIPKVKRGAVLLSTLPRSKSDLYGDNIFSSVMEAFRPLKEHKEKLMREDGLELVLKHLDKRLGACKDKAFSALYNFKREPSQSVIDYVDEFETLHNRCTRAGNNLADGESAVWLLKGANIKNEDIRKIYDIFMLLNDKTEADQMYPTALQKLRDVFA